ncbi:MAG: hypothetical protein QNK37_21535 [Acidobacteriota bacterium]|nr:hypothetical protein [Acidobacteriota bacterium]
MLKKSLFLVLFAFLALGLYAQDEIKPSGDGTVGTLPSTYLEANEGNPEDMADMDGWYAPHTWHLVCPPGCERANKRTPEGWLLYCKCPDGNSDCQIALLLEPGTGRQKPVCINSCQDDTQKCNMVADIQGGTIVMWCECQ